MKKVLITGAFGNLGLMCVDEALKQGFIVHCLDINNPVVQKKAALYQDKVRLFLGDINDSALLEKAMADVDGIIHNVCLLPPITETAPDLAYQVNVKASLNLITLAEKCAKQPRIVYPSSFTVFKAKADKKAVYCATDAVQATDNYTKFKIEVENALQQSQLDWVITRIGVSVDARTLKTDRKTFKQLLAVSADNPMEYVHPKDVAKALVTACAKQEAVGKVLLLGGGKACQITQYQFLSIAFKAFGLTLPKKVLGNNNYYTRWLDTTDAQNILEFQQHTVADYEKEMLEKLKTVRFFIKPLAFLINPLLPFFLRRL